MFEKSIAPIQEEVKKLLPTKKEHIATMQPQKGQKVWKYNLAEKSLRSITQEDFEKVTSNLTGKVNKRLVMEKGSVYVVAINKKNAAKKCLKLLNPHYAKPIL